jgi:glucose/arabinose dehydrogenase
VVSPDGDTTTLAGGDQGYADGPAAQARFNAPCGVAVGPDGSVYVADTGNRCIRRIARGTVITVAGKPGAGDATGAAADLFSSVAYVAAPAPHLVVADAAARRLQEFSLEGKVGSATSVAGPPTAVVSNPLAAAVPAAGTLMLGGKALRNVAFAATYEVSDERARSVMVRHPVGLCPLGAGWLVTDSGQGAVILVANGRAEVVAGTCLSDTPSWGFRDGDGAKAMFRTMSGIVSDGKRYAYVADTGNNAIRRLDVSNVVAH